MNQATINVYEEIIKEAAEAANTAFDEARPTPMDVVEHANPLDDHSEVVNHWHIPDGICGNATVRLKPATTKFAKYLKAEYGFEPAYRGGLSISMYKFIPSSQSYERNRQAAMAFARVLTQHGFQAIAAAWID